MPSKRRGSRGGVKYANLSPEDVIVIDEILSKSKVELNQICEDEEEELSDTSPKLPGRNANVENEEDETFKKKHNVRHTFVDDGDQYTKDECENLSSGYALLAEPKSDWIVQKHPYKGMIVKRGKSTDNGLYACHAVTDVFANPQAALAFFWAFMLPERVKFSSKTDLERCEVEDINSHSKVVYVAKRLPPPLTARDFVTTLTFMELKDGRYLMSNMSSSHPLRTEQMSKDKGYIRGTIKSALLFTPRFNGTKCNIKYTLQMDIKGYIPEIIARSRIAVAMSLLWEAKVFFAESRSLSSIFKQGGSSILGEGFAIESEVDVAESNNESEAVGPNGTRVEKAMLASIEGPTTFFLWLKRYGEANQLAQAEFLNRRIPNLWNLRKEQKPGTTGEMVQNEEFTMNYKIYNFQTHLVDNDFLFVIAAQLIVMHCMFFWLHNILSLYEDDRDDQNDPAITNANATAVSLHAHIGLELRGWAFYFVLSIFYLLGPVPWFWVLIRTKNIRRSQYTGIDFMTAESVVYFERIMKFTYFCNSVGNVLAMGLITDVHATFYRQCNEQGLREMYFVCMEESAGGLSDFVPSLESSPQMVIFLQMISFALMHEEPFIQLSKFISISRNQFVALVVIWFFVDVSSGIPLKPKLAVTFLTLIGMRALHLKYCSKEIRQRNFFYTFWEQYADIYRFEIEKENYGDLVPEKRQILDEILNQVNDLGGEFSEANRNARIKRLRYDDIEFHKVIGNGKFGKVFQGYHFSRIVAVKQIRPESITRQSLMAFVAEIHMMSHIRHNNIIECVGAVLVSPYLCLVTEFAKRGSLKNVLRSSKNLTWVGEKRKFLIDVAAGMTYLHRLKNPITHRDLKADNCLVCEDMTVKVADFGLARTMKGSWEMRLLNRMKKEEKAEVGGKRSKEDSGEIKKRAEVEKVSPDTSIDEGDETEELSKVIGTPMYMAPEVIMSDKYDERIDIYSYGMLMADILMDGKVRKLFMDGKGQLGSEVLLQLVAQGWRVKIPQELVYQVPVVMTLMTKCLSQDPSDRPSFKMCLSTLQSWDGYLDDSKVVNLMHNLEPYSDFEENFLAGCAAMSGEDLMSTEQNTKSMLFRPDWFKINSPDPKVKMSFRGVRSARAGADADTDGAHYKNIYVGKATRNIKASSYMVVQWLWDWMDEKRLQTNKAQGELERSIVEQINEHHMIVSSTKCLGPQRLQSILLPREGIMRFIWKEVQPRSYVMGSESTNHPSRPLIKGRVRCYFKSFYKIEPCHDGSTNIMYMIHTDLKGSAKNLPFYMVQHVLGRNLLHVSEVANVVEKEVDKINRSSSGGVFYNSMRSDEDEVQVDEGAFFRNSIKNQFMEDMEKRRWIKPDDLDMSSGIEQFDDDMKKNDDFSVPPQSSETERNNSSGASKNASDVAVPPEQKMFDATSDKKSEEGSSEISVADSSVMEAKSSACVSQSVSPWVDGGEKGGEGMAMPWINVEDVQKRRKRSREYGKVGRQVRPTPGEYQGYE